jgi:putative flippase GtrA
MASQSLRFVLAGGVVTAIYVAVTTLLAEVMSMPFEAALVIGYCVALVVHYSLQRTFVWSRGGGFALRMHRQLARYLAVALTQYALTAASTSILPSALGLPTEVVYLVTAGAMVGVNFLVLRHVVFHSRSTSQHIA